LSYRLEDQGKKEDSNLSHLLRTLTATAAKLGQHKSFLDGEDAVDVNDEIESGELLQLSATTLAHELTRIELDHLAFLGASEFVHAFARDSSECKRLWILRVL